jgi:hypothetical protein
VRHDSSPALALLIALIVGWIAASRGRSGGRYGAFAGALFFMAWDIIPLPFSLSSKYAAAVSLLSLNAALEGLVWGGIWGLVGGALGRKKGQKFMAKSIRDRDQAAPPAPGETKCPKCQARMLDEPGPLKCFSCGTPIRD